MTRKSNAVKASGGFHVLFRTGGLSDSACREALPVRASESRQRLSEYATMRVLDVRYSRLEYKALIDAAPTAEVRKDRQRVAA